METKQAQHTPDTIYAHKAPHAVTDRAKLGRMIDTLNAGGVLPPVLWDGNQAFEGSHRLAAWEAVGQRADLMLVTDDDLARAAESLGMDPADVDWRDEDNLLDLKRAVAKAEAR